MRKRYWWNAVVEEWNERRPPPPAGKVHIIRDEMAATLNHADGGTYTSKRAYTKAVRAAGCEIIGNESTDHLKPPPLHRPREVGEDLMRAYHQRRR